MAAPVGFLKTEDGRLEKDPDRRVQEAIVLAFRKCRELGSVRQALLWFLEEALSFPTRQPDGSLVWKTPTYAALHRVVTHPAYAGAYADGKTEVTVHYDQGGRGGRDHPGDPLAGRSPYRVARAEAPSRAMHAGPQGHRRGGASAGAGLQRQADRGGAQSQRPSDRARQPVDAAARHVLPQQAGHPVLLS